MPTYEFMCHSCQEPFEKDLSISEYSTQLSFPCPACESLDTSRQVSETSFVLVGDGWPSKDFRGKAQMLARRKRVGQKMKDHVAPLKKLVPNVGGEEVASWSEAKRLAASKGKDTVSYEPLVQKEKRGDV
jgi:putative FmdB family regulatory protein